MTDKDEGDDRRDRVILRYDKIVLTITTQEPHQYWWTLGVENRLLARAGEQAADLVASGLLHPNARVRRWMAYLLPDIDSTRAARELVPLLSDPDADVRLAACAGVVTRDPESVIPVLHELVKDWALYRVEAALNLLVALGRPGTADVLRRTFPVDDGNIRPRILLAISRLGEEGTRALLALLVHPDVRTRADVCLYLTPLRGSAEPAPEVVPALIARLSSDAEPEVRGRAALALGRLGAREAAAPLLSRLEAAETAESPCRTHGDIPLPSVGELPHVVRALAAVGCAPGFDAIVRLVEHGHGQVRRSAVDALGEYPPSPISESALLRLLEWESDTSTRTAIIMALGAVGGARSVPHLERFLHRESRRLTKRVRKELKRTLPARIEAARKRA